MKLKDILKNEKDYKAIIDMLGDKAEEVEAAIDGAELAMVPHSRFNEVNNKKNESEKAVKELTNKLEKLSKESLTPEAFEQKRKEITDEYEKKVKEAEDKYNMLSKTSAVKEALAAAKAKDINLIMPHINLEKISFRDDKWDGIDEQIKTIQNTFKDMNLFGDVNPTETQRTDDGIYRSQQPEVNPLAKAMGIKL